MTTQHKLEIDSLEELQEFLNTVKCINFDNRYELKPYIYAIKKYVNKVKRQDKRYRKIMHVFTNIVNSLVSEYKYLCKDYIREYAYEDDELDFADCLDVYIEEINDLEILMLIDDVSEELVKEVCINNSKFSDYCYDDEYIQVAWYTFYCEVKTPLK